jgi:23S rRNA pseudouridine1911/1915/1917 synthase
VKLQVLFQDNHLLVVFKPAGVLVQGDQTGDESLLDVVRAYRKETEHKPGAVFVGLVHRLDRPVSGVVAFAKTSKAAARLSEQFREGVVRKCYWAAAEHRQAPPPDLGQPREWDDHLFKDPLHNRVQIVDRRCPGAKLARTLARPLESSQDLTLWELHPLTGRSHQLRVQLAEHGGPIVGDVRYGSRLTFDGQIALHARSLDLEHPTLKTRMKFEAPLPESWRRFRFHASQSGRG